MQTSDIENKLKIVMVRKRKILVTVLLATSISFFLFIFLDVVKNKELEIIYLNIGQGDAILIKSPNGNNLLIDTGLGSNTTQKVQKSLSLLSQELNTVIVTHPDSDHSGGLAGIVPSIKVENIIISTENDYSNYISTQVRDRIVKVSLVNSFNNIKIEDNLYLKILSPEKNMFGDDNQKSMVNTMLYGNFNFIFTGDVDSETERKLVSQGYFDKNQDKKVFNILKVGHHGSDTSSSDIFLKKIKPEYCIISVGRDNKYGHPSKSALSRLEKYCKNIYRTDKDGQISFKTDGKNLKISTEN